MWRREGRKEGKRKGEEQVVRAFSESHALPSTIFCFFPMKALQVGVPILPGTRSRENLLKVL